MVVDQNSTAATSQTSSTNGESTQRWCAPELLDPERYGLKRGGPTKKSDIYSMGMTIYQVSLPRCTPGGNIEVVLGSDGQSPILRVQRYCGIAPHYSRQAT